MRDIIWTVIIVWIVWKLYESFKTISKPKTQKVYSQTAQQNYSSSKEGKTTVNSSNDKTKSHLDPSIGEYVDYEEIK